MKPPELRNCTHWFLPSRHLWAILLAQHKPGLLADLSSAPTATSRENPTCISLAQHPPFSSEPNWNHKVTCQNRQLLCEIITGQTRKWKSICQALSRLHQKLQIIKGQWGHLDTGASTVFQSPNSGEKGREDGRKVAKRERRKRTEKHRSWKLPLTEKVACGEDKPCNLALSVNDPLLWHVQCYKEKPQKCTK